MEKRICAFIFTIAFITFSSIVYGESVDRSPSIESPIEIDIEDAKVPGKDVGFDFASNEAAKNKSRVPANITTKTQDMTPASYIGPIIFLIALPFGLWIMISKKITAASDEKKIDYYPKTQQFKPYKTDYQKSAEDDDDDVDYPKAS